MSNYINIDRLYKIQPIQIRDVIRVEVSQNQYKSKPTKSDVRETIKILNDFGYKNIIIPDFNTLAKLIEWRRFLINKKLNEPDKPVKKKVADMIYKQKSKQLAVI